MATPATSGKAVEKSVQHNKSRPSNAGAASSPAQRNSPSAVAVRGSHRYRLRGVVVHSGSSAMSGHYYAYVKALPAGMYALDRDGAPEREQWYCMDDSSVYPVTWDQVSQEQAYLVSSSAGTGVGVYSVGSIPVHMDIHVPPYVHHVASLSSMFQLAALPTAYRTIMFLLGPCYPLFPAFCVLSLAAAVLRECCPPPQQAGSPCISTSACSWGGGSREPQPAIHGRGGSISSVQWSRSRCWSWQVQQLWV